MTRNEAIEQALNNCNPLDMGDYVEIPLAQWESVEEALAMPEDATPEIQERMDLVQAKQICEQAGFAVVPVEPTPEMLEAGNVALIRIKEDPTPSVFNRAFYCYKAMLEAAKEVK